MGKCFNKSQVIIGKDIKYFNEQNKIPLNNGKKETNLNNEILNSNKNEENLFSEIGIYLYEKVFDYI